MFLKYTGWLRLSCYRLHHFSSVYIGEPRPLFSSLPQTVPQMASLAIPTGKPHFQHVEVPSPILNYQSTKRTAPARYLFVTFSSWLIRLPMVFFSSIVLVLNTTLRFPTANIQKQSAQMSALLCISGHNMASYRPAVIPSILIPSFGCPPISIVSPLLTSEPHHPHLKTAYYLVEHIE